MQLIENVFPVVAGKSKKKKKNTKCIKLYVTKYTKCVKLYLTKYTKCIKPLVGKYTKYILEIIFN